MDSRGYKNELKEKLSGMLNEIDHMYNSMRNELAKEIYDRKEKTDNETYETNEVYHKLNEKTCVELVKKRLPWHVRLFNKIEWCGHGQYSQNQIIVHFCFNGHRGDYFQCVFKTEEVKKILKLN